MTVVVATARLVTMNGQSDRPSEEYGETSGDETSGDELLTRLRVIEGQALETRALAFAQLYDELQVTLEGGDPSPASPDRV